MYILLSVSYLIRQIAQAAKHIIVTNQNDMFHSFVNYAALCTCMTEPVYVYMYDRVCVCVHV